jgi:hypothetical protein
VGGAERGGGVVWVGGAHSNGRVRGGAARVGTDGRLEPFRCHLKLTRLTAGMRYVWRSTRLDYSKAKKVLNRGKTRMRNI